MSAPRTIATVCAAEGYAGILKAFRKRQEQLGISGEKIDEIIGNDGNRSAAKWLSGLKGLGPKSWGDALGSTAMKIIFVEDTEQLQRLAKHLETRAENHVRTIARIRVTRWLFTPRSGRKTAKRRWRNTPKRARVAAAKKAANARWSAERARRAKSRCAPREVSR